MITCALRLTRTLLTSMWRAVSPSSSLMRVAGLTTTPGPDDARDVRVEHARRDEVELEDLVAEHDRVAGVVAALVADGHRDLLGQEVGRLALALVAPLEPDDDGGRHQPTASASRGPRRPARRAGT